MTLQHINGRIFFLRERDVLRILLFAEVDSLKLLIQLLPTIFEFPPTTFFRDDDIRHQGVAV
jgi:hypothetical protein